MKKQFHPNPWRVTSHGVELFIHLQPRTAQNRVLGLYGGAVKIALTAPPVEGAANAALFRFLAAQSGVSIASVSLLSGEKSRDKRVLIRTADVDNVVGKLGTLTQPVDKKNRDD